MLDDFAQLLVLVAQPLNLASIGVGVELCAVRQQVEGNPVLPYHVLITEQIHDMTHRLSLVLGGCVFIHPAQHVVAGYFGWLGENGGSGNIVFIRVDVVLCASSSS
ncbi:hypothetical protein D3C77_701080 [compost metagenome]